MMLTARDAWRRPRASSSLAAMGTPSEAASVAWSRSRIRMVHEAVESAFLKSESSRPPRSKLARRLRTSLALPSSERSCGRQSCRDKKKATASWRSVSAARSSDGLANHECSRASPGVERVMLIAAQSEKPSLERPPWERALRRSGKMLSESSTSGDKRITCSSLCWRMSLMLSRPLL
eukprot:scaffold4264_cov116-Isochrysis_galbana.AAC.3